MSSNIFQVFSANPAASLLNTDLMYLGRSPYTAADDFAITWLSIKNSILAQLPIVTFTSVTGATQILAPNKGYIANYSTGILNFTLPATITAGSTIRIIGAQQGWKINQLIGQQINIQGLSSTLGAAGFVSSNLPTDCIELICTADNSFFTGIPVGNLNIF